MGLELGQVKSLLSAPNKALNVSAKMVKLKKLDPFSLEPQVLAEPRRGIGNDLYGRLPRASYVLAQGEKLGKLATFRLRPIGAVVEPRTEYAELFKSLKPI